jgi:hypothetical protein
MPSAFSRRARPRVRGDGPDEVLRRLGRELLEEAHPVRGEAIEIGDVADESAVDEPVDRRAAEMLDVHGAPRAEVAQPFLDLGRTAASDAAPVRFALGPDGGRTPGLAQAALAVR